jgi:leucyl aminopeptidase
MDTELTIKLMSKDEWHGDLAIILVPGLKAQPGNPGEKAGSLLLVESPPGSSPLRRLVISVGQEQKIDAEAVRRAGGAAIKWLSQNEVEMPGFEAGPVGQLSDSQVLGAFTEGALLGSFSFDELKSKEDEPVKIHLKILARDGRQDLEEALKHSQAVAAGVNLARQISHQPPNLINPITLAQRARDLAERLGLNWKILEESDLQEIGAGAILAVGQGSLTPPRLIVIEYPGQNPQANPLIVIGKAITFDTGGYSLKTSAGMVGMKFDKCGGADVLGVIQAAVELNLPERIVGIIAAAENMVSAEAYRPNDIITSLSGKTVEIISTDAEGRLVLADALTYARQNYQPRAIIDLATLTGGVVVALGTLRAGLMANDDALASALAEAGERTRERLWRLPLDDEYFELIKGVDSDLRNSSMERAAHPIVGGIFLKQFVPDGIPWAHLDVAGTASTEKDLPYYVKGATGFGIRLILDYLEHSREQEGAPPA